MMKHLVRLGIMIGLLAGGATAAQEAIFISLTAATTSLQTGQTYEVEIVVENVVDLWAAEVEIGYDPDQLYIIGSSAGSPVQPGPLLPDSLIAPRNRVRSGVVQYTVALVAPAEPINGAGVIARFQVYPLRAGETQLQFRRARLARVSFEQTVQGRTPGEPQDLAFTPVLLSLTVQGDTVQPPAEMTATPPPTSTPIPESVDVTEVATRTVEPTLVNVTRAPVTPTIAVPDALPVPPAQPTNPILIAALALLVIAGIGLLTMLLIYLRRYRR